MKPKEYAVLRMAVEEGVSYGVSRAYKHTSAPDHDNLADQVAQSVMDSICEWFDIGDDNAD